MGKKNRRNKNAAATSGDDMSDVSSLRKRQGLIFFAGLLDDVIFDGGFGALRIRSRGIHRRRFQIQNDDRRNRQQKLEDLCACAQIRLY